MTLDGFALAALILLLFNMLYFQITSPTFLLVSFEVPTVTTLLRGQFWYYFLSLSVAALVAAFAFAASGRPVVAAEIAVIAAYAMFSRNWFRKHIDAELAARDSGDRDAVRRLRRLHWVGMLSHALALVAVVTSIPYLNLFAG